MNTSVASLSSLLFSVVCAHLSFVTFENQGTVDSMILDNIGCACDADPLSTPGFLLNECAYR